MAILLNSTAPVYASSNTSLLTSNGTQSTADIFKGLSDQLATLKSSVYSSNTSGTSNTGTTSGTTTNPFSGVDFSSIFSNLQSQQSSLLQNQNTGSTNNNVGTSLITGSSNPFANLNLSSMQNTNSLSTTVSAPTTPVLNTSSLSMPDISNLWGTQSTANNGSSTANNQTSNPESSSFGVGDNTTGTTEGINTDSSSSTPFMVDIPSEEQMNSSEDIVVNDGYSILKNEVVSDEEIKKYLTENELPYKDKPFFEALKAITGITNNSSDTEITDMLNNVLQIIYILQLTPEQLGEFTYGKVMYKYRYTVEQLNKEAEKQATEQLQIQTQEQPQIDMNSGFTDAQLQNVNNTTDNDLLNQTNIIGTATTAAMESSQFITPTVTQFGF